MLETRPLKIVLQRCDVDGTNDMIRLQNGASSVKIAKSCDLSTTTARTAEDGKQASAAKSMAQLLERTKTLKVVLKPCDADRKNDMALKQSNTPSVEIKNNSNFSASTARTESEAIAAEVEKKEQILVTKSACQLPVQTRALKIVLERCDAGRKSNIAPERNNTSGVKTENCSDFPAVKVKMEGGAISAEEDNKEGNILTKLDNHLAASSEGSKSDSKQLLKMVKCEAIVKKENEEESDFDGLSLSEIYGAVPDDLPNTVSDYFGNIGMESSNDFGINIVFPLNGHLPIPTVLQNNDHDSKPLLKIIKCEDSVVRVENVSPSPSTCLPTGDDWADEKMSKKYVKVGEEYEKASLICSRKVASQKLYSCASCPFKSRKRSNLIQHLKIHSGVEAHVCKLCCAQLSDEIALERHLRTHTRKLDSDSCTLSVAKLTQCRHTAIQLTAHLTDEGLFACTKCSAKFKQHCNLTTHLAPHSIERRFDCAHCGAKFKHKVWLTRHLKMHSNERPYSCTKYLANFKHHHDLTTHLIARSTERLFECADCGARFNSKCAVVDHLRMHSTERPYSCTKCPAKFKRRSNLRNHPTSHATKKNFRCAHCGGRFKDKSCLRKHLRRHSSGRPYSCTKCPAKFMCRNILMAHLTVHSTKRHFECADCGAKFKSKNALMNHMRSHSSERPYSCTKCPAKFKQRRNLMTHCIKHSSERLFECAHCGTRFKSKYTLTNHIARRHSDGKPFSCSQCPSTFTRASYLKQHLIITHRTNGVHTCVRCLVKFRFKDELARHLVTDSCRTSNFCPHCMKAFKYRQSLRLHLQSHTRGKLHSCDESGTKFSWSFTLTKHRRGMHFDTVTLSCDECAVQFKTFDDMKFHSLVHPNVRPSECEFRPSSKKSSSCDECPAKCKTHDELEYHGVVHSNGRVVTRDLCSKTFNLNRISQEQSRLHVSENDHATLSSCHSFEAHSSLHSGGRELTLAQYPMKSMPSSLLEEHLTTLDPVVATPQVENQVASNTESNTACSPPTAKVWRSLLAAPRPASVPAIVTPVAVAHLPLSTTSQAGSQVVLTAGSNTVALPPTMRVWGLSIASVQLLPVSTVPFPAVQSMESFSGPPRLPSSTNTWTTSFLEIPALQVIPHEEW